MENAPPSTCDQTHIIFGTDDVARKQDVEKRLAYLKVELGITPTEEQYWEPFTAAIRDNAKDMQNDMTRASEDMYGQESAIDYQQSRVLFANLRAQCETRFLTALEPLYDRLSIEQKQATDDLLVPESADAADDD